MTQPIAFVLLRSPGPPDLLALVDTLRQRHPELSWNTDSAIANRPRCPFILCGSRIVVLLALDAPFPIDDGVWARAATTWPEAHGAAARHRAHVIVSLMGESESRVEDARIVTAVVGGLIATALDPCGVVFCGTVARSPQVWLELSAQTFAPYPDYPFMLWIDIAQFQAGSQIVGALTCGLSRFTGREIEFEAPGPSPGLIQRVAGLAVTSSNMAIRSTTATRSAIRTENGSRCVTAFPDLATRQCCGPGPKASRSGRVKQCPPSISPTGVCNAAMPEVAVARQSRWNFSSWRCSALM
jgi:hypothetical protein